MASHCRHDCAQLREFHKRILVLIHRVKCGLEGKCFWMKMVGRVSHGSVLDYCYNVQMTHITSRCDAFNLDKYPVLHMVLKSSS